MGERDRPANRTSNSDARETPFAFLLETEADVVAPFLARENPQTVAVVLSFLRRSQAAELLKRLELPFQTQVLSRLARLEDIDPACIHVLAEELQGWIARQHESPRNAVRGDGLLRDMLAGGRQRDREELIASLQREASPAVSDRSAGAESPGRLAQAVPIPPARRELRKTLEFRDLISLASDDLLRTLQAVPRDVLSLALVGADEGLIRRITQAVSRREARQIKRSLRLDGPTRLGDIEAAKRRVARIATEIVYGGSQ
jgi:flagellar motor switch protein FliG